MSGEEIKYICDKCGAVRSGVPEDEVRKAESILPSAISADLDFHVSSNCTDGKFIPTKKL